MHIEFNPHVCENKAAQQIMKIKWVKKITSTEIIAHTGNSFAYRNGQNFSSSLGLVPSEHSSGRNQSLGRITKRGNHYIQRLLIQRNWSVIRYADKSDGRLSRGAKQVSERRDIHKAVIAIADKYKVLNTVRTISRKVAVLI